MTSPIDPTPGEAPLEGLRVVEFGQYIAVPAAAQTLRDLGAEVVKVEAPGGDMGRYVAWAKDDFGPMFSAYNRGKRSVSLDLRRPEDRDAAWQLAVEADVVLQNMRPGAMERLGLSAERLRAANPRLIYGSVSGFDASTPYSDRVGLDIAAQAESGMMSINGSAGSPPTRVGFQTVDVLASHALTSGVLAALVRRGVTGRGGTVDVALTDVAAEAMALMWAEYGLTSRMPTRTGNGNPTAVPAAEVAVTADGAVVFSAHNDEHFVRLANAIDRPELSSDPRFSTNAARVAHRDALLQEIVGAFSAHRTDELCNRLGRAGVVIAAVRRFDQVREAPSAVSPDLFVDARSPAGREVAVPARRFRVDGQPPPCVALPAIGQDNEAVIGPRRSLQP